MPRSSQRAGGARRRGGLRRLLAFEPLARLLGPLLQLFLQLLLLLLEHLRIGRRAVIGLGEIACRSSCGLIGWPFMWIACTVRIWPFFMRPIMIGGRLVVGDAAVGGTTGGKQITNGAVAGWPWSTISARAVLQRDAVAAGSCAAASSARRPCSMIATLTTSRPDSMRPSLPVKQTRLAFGSASLLQNLTHGEKINCGCSPPCGLGLLRRRGCCCWPPGPAAAARAAGAAWPAPACGLAPVRARGCASACDGADHGEHGGRGQRRPTPGWLSAPSRT